MRFTCPEFTALCPVTGQPDFAHLVIDYVPRQWLVESKSLKLYLGAFRNHGAFHEACTLAIAKRLVARARAALAAHRRLLVSARRHADRRLLPDGRAAARSVAARPGRGALSRAGMSAEVKAAIRDEALRLGFDAVGFAAPALAPEAARPSPRVPGAGLSRRHGLARGARRGARGAKDTLARGGERRRARPQLRARRRIRSRCSTNADRGAVSVYAQGRDYHDVVKRG